jgi:hypothetical protein
LWQQPQALGLETGQRNAHLLRNHRDGVRPLIQFYKELFFHFTICTNNNQYNH